MNLYHCLSPRISLDGLEIAEMGCLYYGDTCCQTSATLAETFPRYWHIRCCACAVLNVLFYVIDAAMEWVAVTTTYHTICHV